MLDCNTTECPKCQHRFQCCRGSATTSPHNSCCQSTSTPPPPPATTAATTMATRTQRTLTGGGIISPLSMTPFLTSNPLDTINLTTTTTITLTSQQQPTITLNTVTSNVLFPQQAHQQLLSPQVSPSIHLAFILPAALAAAQQCQPNAGQSQQSQQHLNIFAVPPPPLGAELLAHRLIENERTLNLCGWYHGPISYPASINLLTEQPVGTFLVRDSTDPRFKYSLSVQTDRGPTSVRLHYSPRNGKFRLDAQSHLAPEMPQFASVVALVRYYVRHSDSGSGVHVWVDPKGNWYSDIVLKQPLRVDCCAPRLKHLARLAVHKAVVVVKSSEDKVTTAAATCLNLPDSVKAYLGEYPYSI